MILNTGFTEIKIYQKTDKFGRKPHKVCIYTLIGTHFSLYRPHWADSVIESSCPRVCVSVCLSVTIQNTLFRRSWKPTVKERIANIDVLWHTFFFSFCIDNFWRFSTLRLRIFLKSTKKHFQTNPNFFTALPKDSKKLKDPRPIFSNSALWAELV